MLAFAVTSLDSASKTLLNDVSRISKRRNHKERSNFFLKVIMAFIGTVNLVILYTGVPRLFTILLCLIFVPFLIRAIIYSIKFATGKVDFSKSGTITMEEYNKMLKESGKEPIENEFDKTSPFQGVSDQDIQ
jgi:Na+/H+ antiporter NhaC